MPEQSEESSESNPLSTTPVEELDGDELVEEQEELATIAHHEYAPHIHEWHEDAIQRLEDVWAEIRSRSETAPPECPRCAENRWTSPVGENVRCVSCGWPSETELHEAVLEAWDTMLEEVAA